MNRIFSSYLPCISKHGFKYVNSMYIPVLIFAVITTFMFISGNEAKAQSPINCDGSLNCPMPEVWRTRNAQFAVDDACIISISFRYTRCCAGCNYVIEILSINSANTWNGDRCSWITHDPVYYAIKLAIVEFHKLEPTADMNPITVKTNACYVFEPLSWSKTKLEPCSNLCCITNYWVGVYPDYLTVTGQQTLLNGNQPMNCGQGVTTQPNPDCAPVCHGHIIGIPEQINLSDYPDVTLCDLNCYWRLDGNKNVTDQNFIGPTNGEDFVIKTLNTEGNEPVLMERIRVDNNRKIDFKLNSWFGMPQITFDADYSGTTGSTIVDDPTIKIYRPTGELPIDGKYKVFPWWVSVNIQNGEGSQGVGAFNIWSEKEGFYEPYHGDENSSTMTKRFSILRNGNVGIGVENPTAKLEINGQGYEGLYNALNINNSQNSSIFEIKDNGDVTAQKVLIGVGTSNPNYKLEVNGFTNISGSANISGTLKVNETIYTTEVIVKDPALWWPDYVFGKSYELTSLADVSSFISKNGHLPEVPSKDDIQKDGVNIVEMQILLLKKVEELTLHLIEMKKDNEDLKKEIEKLKRNR